MLKLSDLPPELRDAIYIEDCHVTGMHDPTHTTTYVCHLQLEDLAKRVLKVIGVNLDTDDPRQRAIESNKIPRRLDAGEGSWIGYYRHSAKRGQKGSRKNYQMMVDDYERWEREGVRVPAAEKATA